MYVPAPTGVKAGGSKEQEITAELAGSEQGTVPAAPAVPDGRLLADLPPMPPGDACFVHI